MWLSNGRIGRIVIMGSQCIIGPGLTMEGQFKVIWVFRLYTVVHGGWVMGLFVLDSFDLWWNSMV